jgi:hypothetical protein
MPKRLDYQTTVSPSGQSVTTLVKSIRHNKEDRVARLEWAPNGGLGRAVIGKVVCKPTAFIKVLRCAVDRILYPCLISFDLTRNFL